MTDGGETVVRATARELEALRSVAVGARDAASGADGNMGDVMLRVLAELAEWRARHGAWIPPTSWNVIPTETEAEWLDARRRYLTASDVPAVLGQSPWKSRKSAVLAKARGLEIATNRYMLIGQELEDGAIRAFGRITGKRVTRVRSESGASQLAAHPRIPQLAASLDGAELDADGLPVAAIECKVTKGDTSKYRLQSAMVQLRVQMSCVGLDRGHLVVCAGTDMKIVVDVKQDPQLETVLEAETARFWRDVEEARRTV